MRCRDLLVLIKSFEIEWKALILRLRDHFQGVFAVNVTPGCEIQERVTRTIANSDRITI